MGRFVALVRGLDAGEDAGLERVLAYIGFSRITASLREGYAVFDSEQENKRKMEAEIAHELKHHLGLDTAVIVKTAAEIQRIAREHPFAGSGDSAKLYVCVLSQDPAAPEVEALMETMNQVDRHELANRSVYSYYGEGYEASKRSNGFLERMLKVSGTTRSWAVILELARIAGA